MTARTRDQQDEQERAELEAAFDQLAALAPEHFRAMPISGVSLAIVVKRKDKWRPLIWHNYHPAAAALASFEPEDILLGALLEFADRRGWRSGVYTNLNGGQPEMYSAAVYPPGQSPAPTFYANNRSLAVSRAVVYALTAPGESHQGESA